MMISNQAKTVFVTKIIELIAVVIIIIMSKLPLGKKIGVVICTVTILGIGAILLTSVVNCMVYGNCASYAWMIAGVMIVSFVIAVVSSIVAYAKIKHEIQKNATLVV